LRPLLIATYLAVVAVLVSALAIGQAALALCGARRWSWLAPAVGLALVCAICWATVRMPGDGVVPAILVPALAILAALHLRGRLEGGGEALRLGWPVALGALLAASLPFAVEGHFGILGTGFNPDMSQHLLATDRLAHGAGSQLLHQGYPLGPHAAVVALNEGLGVGIVQGFDGLTIAAVVVAALTAFAVFAGRAPAGASGATHPPMGRESRTGSIVAALLVGLPYLVASYFAQGAFKELIQAVLVLAFVLALRESNRAWRHLPLRFAPAALLAIGSVYVYSFPGLIWLAAIATIWALLGRASGKSAPTATGPATRDASALRAASLAVLVFLIGSLPELGRMIDFHSFETFAPNGPGLGNLFGQISPFTALGIWPSGDFRLAPGDGAVPAFIYYLGAALATALFLLGIRRAWRTRESSLLAGLASVGLLYVAARVGGTPYTSAKALEIAAPLATLAILLPLSAAGGGVGATAPDEASATAGGGGSPGPTGPAGRHAASLGVPHPALWLYLLAAGACSLLALANAPVGPTSYSPALTSLRPLFADSSVLVLAPDTLLAGEHGEPYLLWELRGGRVCVQPASSAGGRAPVGVRFVVTEADAKRPFRGLVLRRRAGPYAVWEHRGVVGGPSPCPLIAVRQARASAS